MALCFLQGCFSLGMGLYQRSCYNAGTYPDLGVQVGFIVLMAVFGFQANGAVFALVPHLNSFNNGFMSGLTGGFGNLGGIVGPCLTVWRRAFMLTVIAPQPHCPVLCCTSTIASPYSWASH